MPATDAYETPNMQGDQHQYDVIHHRNHDYENAAAAAVNR